MSSLNKLRKGDSSDEISGHHVIFGILMEDKKNKAECYSIIYCLWEFFFNARPYPGLLSKNKKLYFQITQNLFSSFNSF